MYYVYILKSIKDNRCYIGYTSNLKKRLLEHKTGLVFSTKGRLPIKLVYCEVFLSQNDAVNREQRLKNYGKGITELYKRIRYSLDS